MTNLQEPSRSSDKTVNERLDKLLLDRFEVRIRSSSWNQGWIEGFLVWEERSQICLPSEKNAVAHHDL